MHLPRLDPCAFSEDLQQQCAIFDNPVKLSRDVGLPGNSF
jgi:hypothetical protein